MGAGRRLSSLFPRPRALVALVACALVAGFAGCVGEEAPATEPAAPAAAPGGTPAPEALANTSAESAAPLAPVSENVSYSGETGTWACVFSPNAPMPLCQGQFSTTATKDLAYRGTPLRITGTVTWTPATPAPATLAVRLMTKVDGRYTFNETSPAAAGSASPLAFDFDLAPFAGMEIAIDVSSFEGHPTPDGGFAGGSVAQPFDVVATLVYQPAP